MKTFTVAAVILALVAAPAYAQSRRPGAPARVPEESAPKVDDKAYKSALDRIPEPKEKYDPWGVARPAEPAKSAEPAKKSKQGP
jgi:hypothetical protein